MNETVNLNFKVEFPEEHRTVLKPSQLHVGQLICSSSLTLLKKKKKKKQLMLFVSFWSLVEIRADSSASYCCYCPGYWRRQMADSGMRMAADMP